MPKLLKAYYDFRGGLNTDAAPENLADNELMQADNCVLLPRGGLAKRQGTMRLNSASYGAEVGQLIEWPRNSGEKVLLAIVGITLSKINEDGTKIDLQTLARNSVGFFFLQDKFYFVDGSEYRVYDGTIVSTVTPDASADNNLAPIKRCRFLLRHTKSNRIFAAGDSQDPAALYYSEPNKPDYFKVTSKLYPTTGDGPITALAIFGDAVLVFYPNSIWAWRGIDPTTDAIWSKIPIGQGTVAPRSIALTANSLTFLGQGGIYAIGLGILDYNITFVPGEELVVNLARNKVTNIVRSIVHPETACAVWDRQNERYLLAYGDDPLNPRNNKVLVLNWSLKAFTRYTGWEVNDFCLRSNGDLLIATNGYILKANQGYRDIDLPIPFVVKTKELNLDYPVHRKKTYRLFLAALQELSMVSVKIDTEYDSVFYSIVPLNESFVWGDEWGKIWGWNDYSSREMKCRLQGQRFQVTLENNNVDEPVMIYGLAFEYKVKKPKAIKVSQEPTPFVEWVFVSPGLAILIRR